MLAAAAFLIFPLASSGRQLANTWAGTWDTNFGIMTLKQHGGSVEGEYTYDSGRIKNGQVTGNLLTGRWEEAPSYSGPDDAGTFEWTRAPDGKSWSGKWKYDAPSSSWSSLTWSGTCTEGACRFNGTNQFFVTYSLSQAGTEHHTADYEKSPGRSRTKGSGIVKGALNKLKPHGQPHVIHAHDKFLGFVERSSVRLEVTGARVQRQDEAAFLTLFVEVALSNDSDCPRNTKGSIVAYDDGQIEGEDSRDRISVHICGKDHKHLYRNRESSYFVLDRKKLDRGNDVDVSIEIEAAPE